MGMSLEKPCEIRTGKAGVLQFMWLQRVRHNLTSEQQQHKILVFSFLVCLCLALISDCGSFTE